MMHIGEVARAVGVRASAIRYYEAQGIIQPALCNASGYRFYSDDAVNLLGFVKRAQSIGTDVERSQIIIAIELQRRMTL